VGLQFLNGLQLPAGLPVLMYSVAHSGCRPSSMQFLRDFRDFSFVVVFLVGDLVSPSVLGPQ
jgi:hypothetical protein